MLTGKEGFQNTPEINWNKELGAELQDVEFNYIVPKDPFEIQKFVTAAVYKTLAGNEVTSKQAETFLYDYLRIEDKLLEHQRKILLESARNIFSRDKGYQYEQQEAVLQGKKAREAIDNYGSFKIHYDYWAAIVPIKSSINLDPIEDFPNHLLLKTKLSEIGGIKGFPDNLLLKEVTQEELPKSSILELAQKATAKLEANPSDILQSALDRREDIFVEAMNICGHTNFDEIRNAIVYSGEKGHKTYSLNEKFKMLSGKERQTVQKPAKTHLFGEITKDIKSGNNKAVLFLTTSWMNGEVWYNRKKRRIDGKVIPSPDDSISLELTSVITPNTTHLDLLNTRRTGQSMARTLGFPETGN